jgi:1-acyl-sn-glycerol-3-phosphate acyltransferase
MCLKATIRTVVHLVVLRPLLHLVFGLNIRGRENLPLEGPYVIAANHNSHLDILILFAALPVQMISRTRVVAARDYFAPRPVLFAAVDFLFQPIWVDRRHLPRDLLATLCDQIDTGFNIIIFPEGTRGTAGLIDTFQLGVGQLIADRPETALVPVLLQGSDRSLPRGVFVPVPVWHRVRIGLPLQVSGGRSEITAALRQSILDLARASEVKRHRRRAAHTHTPVVAVLGIDGSGKSTLAKSLAQAVSDWTRNETQSDLKCSRDQLERTQRGGTTCLIGDRLELYTAGAPRSAQPVIKEKLRRWMSAQAKDARSLARYKIPKITELLLRDALVGEVQRWFGLDMIIQDGSPLLNMTAWSALYRPDQLSSDFCARAISVLAGAGGRGGRDRGLEDEFSELRTMRRLGLTGLVLPDMVLFLDVEAAEAVHRIERRGEAMQVHETGEKLTRLREAYQMVVTACRDECNLPTLVIDGHQPADQVAADAMDFVHEVCAAEAESGDEGSP